jgi:hypothetical protein
MSEKYDEAFRIVTKTGSRGSLSYYGPYATKAAAKAQSTALRRDWQMYDRGDAPFEAWIEKSSANWERVA